MARLQSRPFVFEFVGSRAFPTKASPTKATSTIESTTTPFSAKSSPAKTPPPKPERYDITTSPPLFDGDFDTTWQLPIRPNREYQEWLEARVLPDNLTEDGHSEPLHLSPKPFLAARKILGKSVYTRYLELFRFQIGDTNVPFYIHAEILRKRCPVFLRKVRGKSRQDSKAQYDCKSVDLPDVHPATFRLFVGWAYSGKLAPVPAEDAVYQRTKDTAQQSELDRLVDGSTTGMPTMVDDLHLARLYAFAQNEHIKELQTSAVTTLARQNTFLGRTTTKGAIKFLLTNCAPNSLILPMLTKEAVRRLGNGDITRLDSFPRTYAHAVMKQLVTDGKLAIDGDLPESELPSNIFDCPPKYGSEKLAESFHNLFDTVGTVTIGPEALSFPIHRGLICQHSEYFRGAFKETSGFMEARNNEVNLDEESIADFSLLLCWLYEHQIEVPLQSSRRQYLIYTCTIAGDDFEDPLPQDLPDANTGNFALTELFHETLVTLFIFADRRGIPGLRNKIIDSLAYAREEHANYSPIL